MSRKCEICQSPSRRDIDVLLHQSVTISKITAQFGFTGRQIGSHWHNHVKPFIETANQLAQQEIVQKQLEYHREVSLPLIDKQKNVYSLLCEKRDNAESFDEWLSVVKEMRGWFTEEAKLLGEYTKDRENPISEAERLDNIARRIIELDATIDEPTALEMARSVQDIGRVG